MRDESRAHLPRKGAPRLPVPQSGWHLHPTAVRACGHALGRLDRIAAVDLATFGLMPSVAP